MKKLVLLFSVLGMMGVAFTSCKDDEKKDNETPVAETSYAGTYVGQYVLADTAYDANAVFFNGVLKNRLKLYMVVNFEPTDTAGFYRAQIGANETSIVTSLLDYIGVKTPENVEELVKGLSATAQFDGLGKVNMALNFDIDVQVLDTINLNWQLVNFEGLRK
ncbi:MAG: hypothetical protein J5873_01465 [Bacteroidales bacterium]|nr:hypothetical protein [Bacteroidales bacterium]